jgi:hypothetical protein
MTLIWSITAASISPAGKEGVGHLRLPFLTAFVQV